MNNLKYIVENIVDQSLKSYFFKDVKFSGLCEQVLKDGVKKPCRYKGFGDYEEVGFDDSNSLNIYHRIIGQSDSEDETGGVGNNTLKTEVYTMRMVVFGNQRAISDVDNNINTTVASDLKRLFPKALTKVQIRNIKALSGLVKVTDTNYDRNEILTDETDAVEMIKPETLLFSIDYTITLTMLDSCGNPICDDETPFVDLSQICCENINDDTFGLSDDKLGDCGRVVTVFDENNPYGLELQPGETHTCPTPDALIAAFSADDTTPTTGQSVQFTDASTGSPTAWFWDFGDGTCSDQQNPTHIYYYSGNFTVTLYVYRDGYLCDVEEKIAYIQIAGSVNSIMYIRPLLTGQLTSYATGDDAWRAQNGLYANIKQGTRPVLQGQDPDTMDGTINDLIMLSPRTPNFFNNLYRFTDNYGGQTYSDDYAIDHLSGLGIAFNLPFTNRIWSVRISDALSFSLLGYDDFYLANSSEIRYIFNRWLLNSGVVWVTNYVPFAGKIFNNPGDLRLNTSTTLLSNTTRFWNIAGTSGTESTLPKAGINNLSDVYIRNHFN